MTHTLTQTNVDRAAIDRLLQGEPDWLGDLRRAAFARYEQLPQPDEKTPGWRRLTLEGLDLRAPSPRPTRFRCEIAEADRFKIGRGNAMTLFAL